MSPSHLFLELTDRHGRRELHNLALFAVVAPDANGGCKLYPRSQNERYDGVATHVQEGLDAFRDLPGFVPVDAANHDLSGPAMLNMAKVASVSDDGGRRVVRFPGVTSTLRIHDAMDEVKAAMHRDGQPFLARRKAA